MPKLIRRLLLLSVVCAGGAFGQSVQGTFAQIAYGGSWQTTFTLVNTGSTTDPANGSLSFFRDDGSPLNAPVQDAGNFSVYPFTIPPGGALNIVLAGTDPTTTPGWASMTVTSGTVRGQGSFRFLLPGGQISEAVVPLNATPAFCFIVCLSSSSIIIPFDNTTGVYTTSIALANTMSTTQAVSIEFDDQSNAPLATDTMSLTANQHMAFVTPQKYPVLANKKGIIRITDSTNNGGIIGVPTPPPIIALGLLSNITNAVTTIMPITQ